MIDFIVSVWAWFGDFATLIWSTAETNPVSLNVTLTIALIAGLYGGTFIEWLVIKRNPRYERIGFRKLGYRKAPFTSVWFFLWAVFWLLVLIRMPWPEA